jgi:GNAT superfamily N-acetyltransferase
MITIRPATADDAAAIARVHVKTWQSVYRGIVDDEHLDALSVEDRTERWSEILQRSEQATFVASSDKYGIVGFANGGPEREGREDFDAELYAIYILPEWHGRGIGRELVATFTRWLTDSGFDSMIVWVLAQNPARRFYENLGGRNVGNKTIEIGWQTLAEMAYGWDDLGVLIDSMSH